MICPIDPVKFTGTLKFTRTLSVLIVLHNRCMVVCIVYSVHLSLYHVLHRKTRSMVENVLLLNEGGWQIREEEQAPSNSATKTWSGRDDCLPVSNSSEFVRAGLLPNVFYLSSPD